MRAWWAADDHGTSRMTDDGAGVISSWTDRIGGIAVTAATTARPTWAATSFNSAYPGVTFDGVANCLAQTSFAALPTGAVPGEIWMILDNSAPITATETPIRYGGVSAATNRGVACFDEGGDVIRFLASDAQTNLINTSSQFVGLNVGGAWWTTASEFGRVNGAPTVPASAVLTTTPINTGTSRIRIGANNANTAASFFSGVIRHVFITQELTAIIRLWLESWLAWDSGLQTLLPTTHPFRYVRP